MNKKLLALMLALCLVLNLAACGGAAASSAPAEASASGETAAASEVTTPAAEDAAQPADDTQEAAPDASAEEADAEAPEETAAVPPTELPLSDGSETFQVWMGISPAAMNYISSLAENETYKEIMNRTGVNLEFIHFHPSTETEEFNLVMASGDYPDVMNGVANSYTGGADQGIEDEVFLDLNDYLEDCAPHYYSIIHSDKSLYEAVTTPEGAAVGFYSVYEEPRLNDIGYIIRQDWLTKLGLETPKTYDQLHEALAGFKDEFGATDALFIPASGVSDTFIAGFDVGSGMYLDGDTVKYGPLEEGYKEYLQLMADWYAEGLIYHDFPFYGNELNFRDPGAVGAGQVACFRSETGDMAMFGDFSEDPDILFTAMAPVGKNEGDTIHMTDMAPSRADTLRWSVTTGCEDPELIIAMVDYLYSEEGALLCNYGIEGETFDFDEQGVPHFSDLIYNNPEYDYRTAVFIYVMDAGPTVVDPMRGAGTYTQEQLDSWGIWAADNLDYSGVIPARVTLKAEDSEYNNIASDIETFMDEYTVKYVTGELSFDTYDTDFVEKLRSMDAERMVELYQDAYDEYLAG